VRIPARNAERRRALASQLERLRDLYVMGDLTKPEYVTRRQALEEELQPKADASSEATMTGATGLKRAFVASGIEIRL
jgi:hypothetical protein